MYKTVMRAAPRRVLQSTSRRLLSTAAPAKKRGWGWKGTAARWGLAGAGVYYYNTSDLFAEEPEEIVHRLADTVQVVAESKQPTIDAIVEEKRVRYAEKMAEERKREQVARAALAGEGEPQAEEPREEGEGGLEGLEEEAGQQGAFNPETGEINWDCPCLGGMAHGPCGDEFKAAFSCFVYSEEEPKGVECIDKFKGMQDCFRANPEVYASELEDDEAEIEAELARRDEEGAEGAEQSASESAIVANTSPAESSKKVVSDAPASSTSTKNKIDSVPAAAHNASSK